VVSSTIHIQYLALILSVFLPHSRKKKKRRRRRRRRKKKIAGAKY